MHRMCPSSAKAGFMFRFMDGESTQANISFVFEGQPIEATQGMSVAAALLAHGITAFRESAVSHTARGPFCLMGTCYECVVLVDGVSVQACMTQVRAGLVVDRLPTVTKGNDA